MDNRDFIITSQQSWDTEIGSTIKNVAVEISKRNRVFFINTPMDYSTWLRRVKDKAYVQRMNVIKGRTASIREINPNMWIIDCPFIAYPVNHIPTTGLFDFVNKLNNEKIAKRINEIIRQFNIRNFIHIMDTDIYRSFYLKELIKPALSVYYCRDYVFEDPYWKGNGPRLEPILAAHSDMVITNSTLFNERFLPYNANTYAAETGVNLDLYDAAKEWPVPADIQSVAHPIVGYVGYITSKRLDCELIYQVVQERPNYSFVFVGPEDEVFASHPIHQLPNAHFFGHKQVEQLPAYINIFDVCLNFQLVNEITDGNYPLKIDEYLAMGKPVVATSTHTMRDIFSQHVYLPSDEEGYLESIDKALTETRDKQLRDERIRFAHSHSWENSVNKMYTYISVHLPKAE